MPVLCQVLPHWGLRKPSFLSIRCRSSAPTPLLIPPNTGRTPGGQFSFTSRSGTDQWHGLAFDYLRNEDLDANNWFNDKLKVPRTPERQNDFGGTFSGPLAIPGLYNGRDKTFFFFSYEGLRLVLPTAAATYTVPDSGLRTSAPAVLQPFLNEFPIANGADKGDGKANFVGGYSAPSTIDSTSLRVDHSVSEKLKLFARYADNLSGNTSKSSADLAIQNQTRDTMQTITAGATEQLSTRFVNDLRFNFTHSKSDISAVPTTYGGATLLDTTTLPGYYPSSLYDFILCYDGCNGIVFDGQSSHQDQPNFVDTFSAVLGRHSLKAGIDYRRLANVDSIDHSEALAYYNSAAKVIANSPFVGIIDMSAYPYGKPVYTTFSAYVQDEWRVTHRLSLSYGLRWELNPAPQDADGNNPYTLNQITNLATSVLAPANTKFWGKPHSPTSRRVLLLHIACIKHLERKPYCAAGSASSTIPMAAIALVIWASDRLGAHPGRNSVPLYPGTVQHGGLQYQRGGSL